MKLLYINVLFLMLIPSFLLMYFILTNKDKIHKALSKKALDKLSVDSGGLSRKSKNIFLFVALIFMILALSRPVIVHENKNIKVEKIPLIVALDMSRSMNIKDIYPSRFEFAKKKSIQFINQSNNLNIGLIAFAKKSFVMSPLTYDFDSLIYLVDNFLPNNTFKKGTDIINLLHTSNALLKSNKTKNLLIITDGGNELEYSTEIQYAKEKGIRIYIIAIGTKDKNPIPDSEDSNEFITDKNGKIITISLNNAIQNLALESRGVYIKYTFGNNDIEYILNDIYQKSQKETFEIQKNMITYTELFYYPLILSLILLFIVFFSFRTKYISKTINVAIWMMIVVSFPSKTHAFVFDFMTIKKAKELYNKHEYTKAIKAYKSIKINSNNSNEIYYNMGNSYYKLKDYERAIYYFKKVSSLKNELYFRSLHNLANSYVYISKYKDAIVYYEKALKIKYDKQTKHNLDELKRKGYQVPNKSNQISNNKQNNTKETSKKKTSISNLEETKWLDKLQSKKRNNSVMMYEIERKKKHSNQADDNQSW